MTTTSAETTIHTTAEIAALIPHRWPFLLVDRIVSRRQRQADVGSRA
jgi:3-hydroxymyristoyl/3-hydroxydecanoyl-(acyl carrier protein) dehydratase